VSGRLHDLLVVGGGPAGLALAAAAARRGLDVLLVEARRFPIDQPCGEGLLPAGLAALEALGLRARLGAADASLLTALRWIDAAGPALELALPAPGGLGVRRTALSAALLAAASEAGAQLLEAEVSDHRRGAEAVELTTTAGPVRGRILVAADGRGSPIRGREGLDAGPPPRPRFGVRRHLALRPWTSAVEVHLGDGVEAYVTPAGAARVGVGRSSVRVDRPRANTHDFAKRLTHANPRVFACRASESRQCTDFRHRVFKRDISRGD